MIEREIELLSPAGSFESMQAAIHAGANAIYFGVEQLNLRTRSSNSIEKPSEKNEPHTFFNSFR